MFKHLMNFFFPFAETHLPPSLILNKWFLEDFQIIIYITVFHFQIYGLCSYILFHWNLSIPAVIREGGLYVLVGFSIPVSEGWWEGVARSNLSGVAQRQFRWASIVNDQRILNWERLIGDPRLQNLNVLGYKTNELGVARW